MSDATLKTAPQAAYNRETDNSERVGREDLVLFINACLACTNQDEYYGQGHESVSLAFLHEYICWNYRVLYSRTSTVGVNHLNRALIVEQLLATGARTPAWFRDEEGLLLGLAVRSLPPHRVYKMFERLRKKRVSNRRTRAVFKAFLSARDIGFDATKYRRKLKRNVRSFHAEVPSEVARFFSKAWRAGNYQHPMLDAYRQARFSNTALLQLPLTTIEGLAPNRDVGRDTVLTKANLTALETQRTLDEREALGLSVDSEALGKLSLTKLCLYFLSKPPTERNEKHEVFRHVFARAVGRTTHATSQALASANHGTQVACVLDASRSMRGSSSKKNRPLAVALGVHLQLEAATRKLGLAYSAFWTGKPRNVDALSAYGQTDLSLQLLEALTTSPSLVIVVSDGYENDPPSAAAWVVAEYRRFSKDACAFVHINPVFDEESLTPRALGHSIPTVGIRDAEDLATVLGFARFAEGHATLSALEAYLKSCADILLKRAEAPTEQA